MSAPPDAGGSARPAGQTPDARGSAPLAGVVGEAPEARGSAPLARGAPRTQVGRPAAQASAGRWAAGWATASRAATAALLGATLGLAGCAGTLEPRLAAQQGFSVTTGAPLDEAAEQALLGGRDRPGRLVELQAARPGRGLTLTIHGINASPQDVGALTEAAAARGRGVATFAWDDRFRRLTDSSQDLARELRAWAAEHPGEPLEIDAHSMGARIAIAALAELAAAGELTMQVRLRLVAPPLGGFGSANSARTAPPFIGELIGGVRPGVDMGTTSAFQRRLEAVALPENVRTVIYLGERDTMVRAEDARFQRVAARLGAEVVTLPGEDHVSVIERVARESLGRE